ncbi:MAG: hypothetical protein U1A07_15645 [Phenylobacterium sp.]|nr:hypothetical protein [Phenylobacterium sp.]
MTDHSEMDAARKAAMQRHFMVTGEVVWEWNALHRTLGYIFMSLLGDRQTHVSNALWLTPGSDKAQRDLLKTAVDWADGFREVDRERLGWVLDQTDKLGAHRNDIVHGYPGFLITENGLTTHLSSGQNVSLRWGPPCRGEVDGDAVLVRTSLRALVAAQHGPCQFDHRSGAPPQVA